MKKNDFPTNKDFEYNYINAAERFALLVDIGQQLLITGIEEYGKWGDGYVSAMTHCVGLIGVIKNIDRNKPTYPPTIRLVKLTDSALSYVWPTSKFAPIGYGLTYFAKIDNTKGVTKKTAIAYKLDVDNYLAQILFGSGQVIEFPIRTFVEKLGLSAHGSDLKNVSITNEVMSFGKINVHQNRFASLLNE